MNWFRKWWLKRESSASPAEVPANETMSDSKASPPPPLAFISDIHGNLQALQAVLRDIEAQGISRIICLGDLVGYGGNPVECVALIRQAEIFCLRGNHDAYVAGTSALPQGRGEEFAQLYQKIREQLGAESCRWLGNLPLTLVGEDFDAAHASLHHPERWAYILTPSDAELHLARQSHEVSFVGHTHKPAMWVEKEERPFHRSLEDLRLGRKQVVNVGAVGQPRDGNPDACYVIYDPQKRQVRWRRVPYDIETAQDAIVKAGMPPNNAYRLERGR